MKATSAIIGPNDDVYLPPNAKKGDWEVELGVVIGKKASYVSKKDALSCVAGYCLINDVSEREYQIERGGTWDKGKGCDTFGPIGPWLVTRDDVPNPQKLGLWLDVNGKRMQTGNTRRPDDASPSFDHLSPKAGVVYDFFDELNVFASYRHGFRVPQQSDLFRQGSANSALGIKPIKVDSFEIGVRGAAFKERVQYELTGFYAEKRDDIVSVSLSPGVTEAQNAGATSHRGLEFGIEAEVFRKLLWLVGNATYAEHKYVSWSPSSTVTLDGNYQPQAPTVFGTVGLRITPLKGLQVSPEWVYVGKYFMDDLNSTTYPGHNFFNLRAKYDVNDRMGIFMRMHNITNVRYSDFSSYNSLQAGTYPGYVPGEPFSVIGGMSYKL